MLEPYDGEHEELTLSLPVAVIVCVGVVVGDTEGVGVNKRVTELATESVMLPLGVAVSDVK